MKQNLMHELAGTPKLQLQPQYNSFAPYLNFCDIVVFDASKEIKKLAQALFFKAKNEKEGGMICKGASKLSYGGC